MTKLIPLASVISEIGNLPISPDVEMMLKDAIARIPVVDVSRPSQEEWRLISGSDEAVSGEEIRAWGEHVGMKQVYYDSELSFTYPWRVDDQAVSYARDAFTHWQPLPQPPKDQSNE